VKHAFALCMACFLSIAWADSNRDSHPDNVPSHRESADPPLACGDYLKQFGRERPEIRFVRCRSITGNNSNDPGFEATYRIQGKDLDAVDAWLATWARWEHLRFSCCQWDAPDGFYRDAHGSAYVVSMFADAYVNGHMVNQRKYFSKLPYATLTITHYLYLP
jgi:hypothetical protein